MRDFIYRGSLYNSDDLSYWAEECLNVLPRSVQGLVAGGSSGCALSSAMVAMSKRELYQQIIYSDDHKSHRDNVDKNGKVVGYGEDRIAIVDDLIDSGSTVRSLSTRLYDWQTLECVIVCTAEGFRSTLQTLANDLNTTVIVLNWEETFKPER